jgi:hypothetical protein
MSLVVVSVFGSGFVEIRPLVIEFRPSPKQCCQFRVECENARIRKAERMTMTISITGQHSAANCNPKP